MSVRIFLSSVSDEFRDYRDQLRHDLTRHNVEVKVQEDFVDLGADTLAKLDTYIRHCDAVVHLIGDMTGSVPGVTEQDALTAKYPDMATVLPPLGEALATGAYVSYTQWEAWLALYHGKLLLTAEAEPTAPRGPRYAPTDDGRRTQSDHLGRLRSVRRYPGSKFKSAADLATHIAYTAILDLLVKDYAEGEAKAREVAEGFIREMAGRVSRDAALDLDGMKDAVRNAIDLYEKEIAGQPTTTNVDAIVDRALAKAREQVDSGKSGLAKATLRRAADEMRRDEAERRERYEQGVHILFGQERDIALAGYDAAGAAAATLEMAAALHQDAVARLSFLAGQADALDDAGRDRGSQVHLVAAIGVWNAILTDVSRERLPFQWAAAKRAIGRCLATLGGWDSTSTRLELALEAYDQALQEFTRERSPLDWAVTLGNVATVVRSLGDRSGSSDLLKQAAAIDQLALEECTRDRAPLDWAAIQTNLGNVLNSLGERDPERGPAYFHEAAKAFRLALAEYTRDREALKWAMAQNNLGNALLKLGELETGSARLDEATAAYRLALEERTRDRLPIQWASTQNNLGTALLLLGERGEGVATLEEAVGSFKLALSVREREHFPLDWAATQNNLGKALVAIAEHETGTKRLEEATVAYRLALQEYTRETTPLQWAMAQSNLGIALMKLGVRTESSASFVEARTAMAGAQQLYRELGFDDAYFARLVNAIDVSLAYLKMP